MNTRDSSPAARTALVFAALDALAAAGDFWIQGDHEAQVKGAHDDDPVECPDHGTHGTADGRTACLLHVATFTATQAAGLLATRRIAGRTLTPGRILAILAISASTHYILDRRRPLARLAHATGKGNFHDTPQGRMLLDQAAHKTVHFLAALAAA
ncbi:hypothetical protein [Streptomyces lavendulae]|uniref:hypothetical protein n=1 Tax=Streptomyces lavendulae TaxID=1914 RepID=UPI003809F137